MSIRVVRLLDGRIEVRDDDTRIAKWFLGGALLLLGLAAYRFLFQGPDFTDRMIGALGAAALLFVGFLAMFERSRFLFDRKRQRVDWSRRRIGWKRRGSLSFDDIVSIHAEARTEYAESPMRRLVVQTKTGVLPFTLAYSGDPGDAILKAARRLNEMLGRLDHDAEDDALLALVREGRVVDAVRHLRTTRGLDLLAAKALVERYQRGEFPPHGESV